MQAMDHTHDSWFLNKDAFATDWGPTYDSSRCSLSHVAT